MANPRLRRIVVAYGINRLGTWFGTVALALAVYDHTQSALDVAAVLIAAQVLPALVVPAVIARVEASKGRHELSALLYIEAVAIGAVAVLLSHFWLPAILLLVAVDGTAALAANALLRTELAAAANRELDGGGDPHAAEQHANAALNVVFSVTFVLGPVLAGLLVASAGAAAALFVDVVSFAISGTLLLDLHPHVEEAGGESVRARVRAAWQLRARGARAAHAADRPGHRADLLRVGGADRGRLHEEDARTRATAATGCSSPRGASAWCSAASSSRAPAPAA